MTIAFFIFEELETQGDNVICPRPHKCKTGQACLSNGLKDHPPNSCGFPRSYRGAEARAARPPMGSPLPPVVRPNTPPRRRVLRPAPLPVVAGPYIRCPPALGSAAATAAATVMLSRSRCVSRAFSRSLSAFQKVRCGLARPGRLRSPPVDRRTARGRG